jgi:glycosyltransferase involved in cell wall biosynthesis
MSVSVIVPAYNAAATLPGALASIAAQTFRDFEIVVVDDGSTDGTAALLERDYPELRYIHQANGGPARARNAGIAAARGAWLAFLDADDAWAPCKLELQMQLVMAAPELVLVACDWAPELPGGVAATAMGSAVPAATRLSAIDILVLNRFQTSTALVRAEAARALNGFDPDLDGIEDWDFWLRVATLGPVAKLDLPLVAYRDTPGSVSKDAPRVYGAMCEMLTRELPRSSLAPHRQQVVLAWHHLRFVVSFTLARRPELVVEALRRLVRSGALRASPEATVRYLVPFLVRRRVRAYRLARDPSLPGVISGLSRRAAG